jgi:hypothetical protein
MRFFEFKNVTNPILESTRGIKGAVDDINLHGKESPFSTEEGGKFVPTNCWFFPLDEKTESYKPIESDEEKPLSQDEEQSATIPATIPVDVQFQNDLATSGISGQLIEVNKKPVNEYAAIVVEITADEGTLHFVRYTKSKKSNYILWTLAQFMTSIEPLGYKIKKTLGANENKAHPNVRFFPGRLGVTDGVMNILEVADKIRNSEAFPKDVPPEERPIIADIIENLDSSMPATKDYKGNYEIQIGEIAGPIALSQGSGIIGGAVNEAQEQLLQVVEPGLTWQAMTRVEYPADESQKLIDSFIISPKGAKIGISAKDGKGGAKASAVSISDTIDKKPDVIKTKNPKFFTEFTEYLGWMDVIKEKDKKYQIFKLANKLGILNTEEVEAVKKLVDDPSSWNNVERIEQAVPRHYNAYMNSNIYRPKDKTLINAKYRKLWHFTTTLAKTVAIQMNDDPERLNRFFKTVLESSNMIQIKSTFQMTSDTEGKFTKMIVIYPPVFEGNIKFDVGKEFYANMNLPGAMGFGFARK